MAEVMDIDAILAKAILSEIEAHEFYTEVAARASNTMVRQTFSELAGDELGHKVFLEACRKDPELLAAILAVPDYKVAEATEMPALSIDMKPADAVAIAMKKEEEAAREYEALAAAASTPEAKSVFENLARMERGHKSRLENLFVGIGYPEVF